MSNIILAGYIAVSLGTQPLVEHKKAAPATTQTQPLVEAAIDKGSTVELVVRCGKATTVISYSKSENIYCSAASGCMSKASDAVARACGP